MKLLFFRFYLGSLLGSLCGHILNFGVVFYAQEVLQMPALAGICLFLSFGTPVFLGMHAGSLCDRRPAMFVANLFHGGYLGGALILAGLATMDLSPQSQIPALLLGSLFTGIGWSYVAPARLTYVVRKAPAETLRKHSIIFNLLMTLGFGGAPLLLGLLRALGGFPAVFFGVAIAITVCTALFFGLPQGDQDPPMRTQPPDWRREAREAFAYLRENDNVGRVLIVCAIVHILLGPVQVLVQPIVAETFGLGVVARGAFLAILAPVLIAGGVFAMLRKDGPRPERALLVAILVAGVALAGTLAPNMPLSAVSFVVFGIGGGFAVALIAATLQARTDVDMRGRVMSFYAISTQFFPALGGLISGVAMALFGPRPAMLVVLVFALIILTRWMPAMWRGSRIPQ